MLFIKSECLIKTEKGKQLARENIEKKRKTVFNIYVKALYRHVITLGTLVLKFTYHSQV